MDEQIYSKSTIEKFLNENLLFNDGKLKKYYDRNLQRDLGKFRARVHNTHSKKDFEKIMYVLVTDSIRDIIIETIGEVSEHMKNMGDVIVSGGEAFNLYVDYNDRIVTSDIDAKFVPRMSVNPQYFGKLQATKLILWDKLGEIAKRLGPRVKRRLITMRKKHPKIFKFLGIGFKQEPSSSHVGTHSSRRKRLVRQTNQRRVTCS